MRTVLIAGQGAVPARLRELIEHGSTVLEERAVADASGGLRSEVDRVVFWAPARDPALAALANASARKEASERRQVIVFVGGGPDALEGVQVSAAELYLWPRDEDRLELAFLTGA